MKISDLHHVVLLNDYVILDAIGPDALSFLQGQLTCDLATLTGEALLGGYCSANGRLLATAFVWQHPTDSSHLSLLIHRSLSEALLKRLSMFVLRSKLKISLRDAYVYGAYEHEPSARVALRYAVKQTENLTFVQAPSGDNQVGRWWVISNEAITTASELNEKAQQWEAQTLIEGVAHIQAENQDMFIPQTLNLELVGGVSFTKGCFPGQEVVARSHYRGTIRRRSALFSIPYTDEVAAQIKVGADLFAASDTENPTGRIINYARAEDRYVLLAEVMLADLEQMDYCLIQPGGPRLQKEVLSYDIHEQRENVRIKL